MTTPTTEDLIAQLRGKARLWRATQEELNDRRAEVNLLICRAKEAGASFAEIREATNMGTGTIQMVLAKAGLL